jgi:hypothetical protein
MGELDLLCLEVIEAKLTPLAKHNIDSIAMDIANRVIRLGKIHGKAGIKYALNTTAGMSKELFKNLLYNVRTKFDASGVTDAMYGPFIDPSKHPHRVSAMFSDKLGKKYAGCFEIYGDGMVYFYYFPI